MPFINREVNELREEERERIVSVDDVITYIDRNGLKPLLVSNALTPESGYAVSSP